MNKFNQLKKAVVLGLCGIFMTSCIGSFQLTGKVLDWNRNLSDKFVNELVFLGLNILPVYSISILADAVVLNSIEFWSGQSALAMEPGTNKLIETQGRIVRVTAKENGYSLEQVGAEHISMELVYSPETQVWSAVTSEGETKIMKRLNSRKVMMFLPDNKNVEAELTAEGVAAARTSMAPVVTAAF